MTEQEGKGRISEETFDEFLAGQGLLEDCEDVAIKRVLAYQIKQAMDAQGLTKTAMAARMHTDRRQQALLLDPQNQSVTLSTLRRAAHANLPPAAHRAGLEPGRASRVSSADPITFDGHRRPRLYRKGRVGRSEGFLQAPIIFA
jgi:hypothetical protein